MPDSTPHIEQVRIESKTLPVRERVEQVGVREDIKVSPCGGINISLSLDRLNEEITINAVDNRNSNPDFVYKKEGGTFDKTRTYGPLPEGDQTFFVKERNSGCTSKKTKEVIHCEIAITVENVVDETYDDSTGEIELSVSTPSDNIEWRFDGGSWFSSDSTEKWTGLDDGTYLVEARDEFGCTTSKSVTVGSIADTNAPSVPQNLTVSEKSGEVTALLDWEPSTDDETSVDHYDVYRSTTPEFSISDSNRIGSDISTTSFEDTEISENINYYYRVTATDKAGNESGSNEVQFNYEVPEPPSWENRDDLISENSTPKWDNKNNLEYTK